MKDRYFELYSFLNTKPAKTIRTFIFGFFFVLVLPTMAFLGFYNNSNFGINIPILAAILINELFISSLANTKPKAKVRENPKNILDSMTFPARKKFGEGENSFQVIKNIAKLKDVKFFQEKLEDFKISEINISKAELLSQAYELAQWVKGDYLTELDLFAAYILLSEDETHFLRNNKLTNDDIINILYWTGRKFEPDKLLENPIKLVGPGTFDSLVYGWNFELKKYSVDLTMEILSRHFPPNVVGQEKAYDQLVIGLSKHEASNVIIVGEPGTGKTTLVEYLAYSSFVGKIPKILKHKKIFELFADRLLSGVTNAGELETRLNEVLAEIASSGNAVVFIPNIENIFGGGGLALDISGVLAEYLRGDKIKIVGTTTPAGLADFITPKTSAADLFEKIEVGEPEGGKVMLILTEKAREIEEKYKVFLKYSALKQSVLQASVYFPERFFPGKAVKLLSDVASKESAQNKKIIDGNDVIAQVEEKSNVAIAAPGDQEKEVLLHLEEKIHNRVVGQDEAVKAVSDAMRRMRSGFENRDRPISTFLFLGPTGVGKTETAKALATQYFGRKDTLIRLDMSEYQTQDQIDRILGSKAGEEFTPNTLVDLIEKQPFSLILLDEFEKAHPKLLNLFLQVFDEGRLTTNQGKTVSFKNAIIIATSNAGTELLREKFDSGESISKEELIDSLLKNNVFTPELLNRFDDVIVFRFLNQDEIREVAKILLTEEFKKISENQIKMNFNDSVLDKIAKEAYNPEFGARNIRRYIEDNIESFLSKLILEDKIATGSEATLSVDNGSNFIVT